MRVLILCLLLLSGCSFAGYTLCSTEALEVQAEYTEIYVSQSNPLWKGYHSPHSEEIIGIGERLVRNIKAMAGKE